ncbi:MAG: hypothetical protein JSR17_10190 [Proteobacteria bacterium]|nr:hypothetical protein [Pseudomonadota bacterium]
MLKNLTVSTMTLLFSLSVSSTLFAADAPKDKSSATNMQFGNTGLTAVEVKNLHHSGKLLVKKIKVTDGTLVNGFFEAVDSQFNKDTVINGNIDAKTSSFNVLSVNGNVKFNTVVVSGPATVNGKVTAEKSDFKNTLTIHGHLDAKETTFGKKITITNVETDLENCKVTDILVQKSGNEAQKLSLKGTSVSGDITFESGKGVIEQDDKSSIGGKVTGAQVEKK